MSKEKSPAPIGETDTVRQIREGKSSAEIIAEMKAEKEGRANGVRRNKPAGAGKDKPPQRKAGKTKPDKESESPPDVDLPGSETPPEPEPEGDGKGPGGFDGAWTWDGHPDPLPVRPLGYSANATYHFISPSGVRRDVPRGELFGKGGLSALFDGDVEFLKRHWPTKNQEGEPTGRFKIEPAAEALIRLCVREGMFNAAMMLRGAGVWRGPGDIAIVHAGDALCSDAASEPIEWDVPGNIIGGALYATAPRMARPAYRDGRWLEAPADVGKALVDALGMWNFARGESAAHLVCGWIGQAMLGGLHEWRSHGYGKGPKGCGKTGLAYFIAAVMGAAAQPAPNNYSEPYLRQMFSSMALAMILDESESDVEKGRVMAMIEMIRHMSEPEGMRGGRGSAAGTAQQFNMMGAVWMSATLLEQLTPQDQSRITIFNLLPLKDDADKGQLKAAMRDFAAHSPALRARMIKRWPVFRQNFELWSRALRKNGADMRQADQLATMIAGYDTLTSDAIVDDARLREVGFYLPWLPDKGDDTDSDGVGALNHLFGSPADLWRGGHRYTIGQLVARARENKEQSWGDEINGLELRRTIQACGVRLVYPGSRPAEGGIQWEECWLAISNQHPALSTIYAGTRWRDGKWAQVLADTPGTAPSALPLRIGGVKQRARLIPPSMLPSIKDEQP